MSCSLQPIEHVFSFFSTICLWSRSRSGRKKVAKTEEESGLIDNEAGFVNKEDERMWGNTREGVVVEIRVVM